MSEGGVSSAEPELAGEAESHDLTGGGRVGIQWYGRPGDAKSALAVIPALGVPSRYYRELARVLVGKGHVVAVISLRAAETSISALRQQRYGYKEVLDVDLATLIPAVQKRVGAAPLYLVGHSLGGQFALLYAGRR